MATLGVIFPPDLPPEDLRDVAVAADGAGLEQLWLWEDCFKESGVAPAAAVLAWTRQLTVGIGLLPVPLRNVALTAMEIATLERMFPGRVTPGIGHGVLDWMGQVGARAASPMTLLREYGSALRELLHGGEVSCSGQYVTLDRVALDWPPASPPPVLIGAVKERTIRLAGEIGDGVILTGDTSVDDLRAATAILRDVGAGRTGVPFDVVVFVPVEKSSTAHEIARHVADFTAAGATTVALLAVGDGPPLAEFAALAGQEIRPMVG